MPQYEYECSACEHRFTEINKIADMQLPTQSPCPSCGETKVSKIMSQTQIVDPFVLGRQKASPAFKEVMGGIAKQGGPRVQKNLSGKY